MKPFNSDVHLEEEMSKIIEGFDIDVVIETGTYKGASTNWFAYNVDKVCTCEINKNYYNEAAAYLHAQHHDNVEMFLGTSPEGLAMFLNENQDKNILVFLDAHWYDYCPLIDELKVIAESGLEPIIVIHDFKVPGHPELGFDSYKGQDYEWDWIAEHIDNIYSGGYNKYYNEKATGSQRGCLFLNPIMK